ncbi:unnamed protein product [Closterium sp. Naga37s-1]|nr:unnamed protein product [Closterium sp. Naga37s-1]
MDTKSDELLFLASQLKQSLTTLIPTEPPFSISIVDVSASPSSAAPVTSTPFPTISVSDVLASNPDAAAKSAASLATDRGEAVQAVTDALKRFVRGKWDAGALAGAAGIGGSGGTAIIAPALKELPVGVPKIIVSTVASGNTAPYVGTSDLLLLPSVADVAGLNAILRAALSSAAAALAGMLLLRALPAQPPSPAAGEAALGVCAPVTVGITMFGVTTPCVTEVQRLLSSKGGKEGKEGGAEAVETVVFHATGTGGRAMEENVASGLIQAVLDITTTEVADFIAGGTMPCLPTRFDAAIQRKVPLVLSLGALDMVNFGEASSVPKEFEGRTLHVHNPQVTLMRTTADENRRIAQFIAGKMNQSQAPVTLLVPEGGLSALDAPGMAFWDPAADAALFDELEKQVVQTDSRKNLEQRGFADGNREMGGVCCGGDKWCVLWGRQVVCAVKDLNLSLTLSLSFFLSHSFSHPLLPPAFSPSQIIRVRHHINDPAFAAALVNALLPLLPSTQPLSPPPPLPTASAADPSASTATPSPAEPTTITSPSAPLSTTLNPPPAFDLTPIPWLVTRRTAILHSLRAQVAAGAKCEEMGGVDLIVIYNSGRFRMAGRGSLAGLLPFADANAVVEDMAKEVLPHCEEMGGARTGISAKCEEMGGVDLIVIYNSGRFRMAGRGSLAGLLPFADANAVVEDMAKEVLPHCEEMGGARTGISAKCEEMGGVDLIVIYNSGRFRMAGRGSLAGLLPFADANAVVEDMAKEVLPHCEEMGGARTGISAKCEEMGGVDLIVIYNSGRFRMAGRGSLAGLLPFADANAVVEDMAKEVLPHCEEMGGARTGISAKCEEMGGVDLIVIYNSGRFRMAGRGSLAGLLPFADANAVVEDMAKEVLPHCEEMGGARTGISAKCEEMGGVDLIVIYNSGRFRMAGRGSLAGLLPFADANAVVEDMAKEVLPHCEEMGGARTGISAKCEEMGGVDLIVIYNSGCFRMAGRGSLAGLLPFADANAVVEDMAKEVLPHCEEMGGARTGISAKCEEMGGVDLIVIYNSGRFRMAGRGSLAGLLPFADANAVVEDMAKEVLPHCEEMGGARTGISAKCEEMGGVDLIVIYNSGRFRMAGRGSLAGLLPFADANAVVEDMAKEVLPHCEEMGGARTGISAKCEEMGGVDLIVIYNSGRFRMAGRGSLAGLLPFADANAVVEDMAKEVLPHCEEMGGARTGISAKCEEMGGVDLIVIYNSGCFRMAGRGSLAGLLPFADANAVVEDMAKEVLPHCEEMGGARTGISAKCEEMGGVDLIVIYNSGRFRMAGRGSLAGLLPFADANAVVEDMAKEVLPHCEEMGGARTGISAKCEEMGGVDLIVIYNSGRFRMAGRGSLAGLLPFSGGCQGTSLPVVSGCERQVLPFADANAVVEDMAKEVLPVSVIVGRGAAGNQVSASAGRSVIKSVPVLAGVCATDPFRQMPLFLRRLAALGFAGVQNFPTVGLYDGSFRTNLEETNMGYPLEVAMIKTANVVVAHMGLTAAGSIGARTVCSLEEAVGRVQRMADAARGVNPDVLVLIGARTVCSLQEAVGRVQRMADAARGVNPDVFVLCHGGPINGPEEACYILQNTRGVHGFYGASSMERLPVESAITDNLKAYKAIRLPA